MLKSVARFGLARGLPGLINFAALGIFTRLIDQREYGTYAMVLAGVMLAYSLLMQWLNHGVLRMAAQYVDQRESFLGTVGRLFVVLALFSAGVVAVGVGVTTGWNDWRLVVAAAVLLIAQAWHDLNLVLATADRLPGRYGILSVIRALAGLALGGLAARQGMGASGLLAGIALGSILSGVYAFRLNWRRPGRLPSAPQMRTELFQYGIPLAGAFVLGYVVSAGDRFLLGMLISPDAAGVYAPAYDLVAQSMGMLLMIVNLAAFPAAVASFETGDGKVQAVQFRKHAAILLSLGVPAAAGLAVLAPSLSEILGPQFAPTARMLLPILAVAAIIGGFKSYYLDLSFQLGRRTRAQVITVAVGAIVNVGLNLVLIPFYGVVGAAYATVGAYVVASFVSWSLGRAVLSMPIPIWALLRASLATGGMCMVLLLVRDARGPAAVLGQIFLGVLSYGVLMTLFSKGQLRTALAS